ncbi:hypothetical protein [Streptomyces chartreusis]
MIEEAGKDRDDRTGDVGAPGGETGPEGNRRLSAVAVAALGVLLFAEALVLCVLLVSLWPVLIELVEAPGEPSATLRWAPLGLRGWDMTADAAMLIAVMISSALGSFVHAATSFATYVGNRRLYGSWLWWYLLRAAIGVALALLVYFLLRGGLFAGSSTTGATNPYGFSGIAGLCGLFSKQATDKLREICDTVLSTRGDGDRDRRDKLARTPGGEAGQGTP